jgi:hypothetical protein
LAATGVTWRTISPQVVDPNSYVQNELNAICIKLACPLRVFMGSEMGVLASSQDAVAWSFRVHERRKNYLTPRLIVPLIDRLIQVGALPPPRTSYTVDWNEAQKLTPAEQAQVGSTITGAMSTFVSGQVDQFIEPVTWLTEVMGWDRDKARASIEATMEHLNRMMEVQAAQQQEQAEQQMMQQQQMMGQQQVDPMTGQPMDPSMMQQDPSMMGGGMDPQAMQDPSMMGMGQPQQSSAQVPGPLGPETQEAIEEGRFDADGSYISDEDFESGNYEPAEQEQEVDPETGEPIEQEPEQEIDPETGEPIPQQEQPPGEDMVDQGQGEVDEETGLQIDPESGMLIDDESGYLVDKESGDVYDPETGETVGNVFEMGDQDQEEQGDEQEQLDEPGNVEEEQELPQPGEDEQVEESPEVADPSVEEGQSIGQPGEDGADQELYTTDPETGRLVHPVTGFQLDQETGDVYTPEGQLFGNVNDREEE